MRSFEILPVPYGSNPFDATVVSAYDLGQYDRVLLLPDYLCNLGYRIVIRYKSCASLPSYAFDFCDVIVYGDIVVSKVCVKSGGYVSLDRRDLRLVKMFLNSYCLY